MKWSQCPEIHSLFLVIVIVLNVVPTAVVNIFRFDMQVVV